MSRMAVAIFAALTIFPSAPSLAQAPTIKTADAMETYLTRVSVNPNCRQGVPRDAIVVCGKRQADRYRVPLVIREAGDPRGEGVYGERERLQYITTPCQQQGAFLIGCGSVGVSVSTNFSSSGPVWRKLAD